MKKNTDTGKERRAAVRRRTLWVRYIFLTLSVGLMALIFWFSSRTREESGEMSDGAAGILREVLRLVFSEEVTESLLVYVRQYAHFFLYACLGVSVSICAFTFPVSCGHGWVYWLFPVLICFIYACTDEIHQLFVPGRSGKLSDVGIDALGFCLTVVVCNLVRLLVKKFSRSPASEEK